MSAYYLCERITKKITLNTISRVAYQQQLSLYCDHDQSFRMAWWMWLILLAVMVKLWYRYTSGACTSKARMNGKTVIVTGANTGIGKETALELARRGARVILACRDEQRGAEARADIVHRSGNENVYVLRLDLGSLKSVRDFVAELRRREQHVHVLINNAAAAGMPNRKSADGLQQEMQINHFGPFLLTLLLIDLLKQSAPSRIIILSSLAHKFARLELDNLNCEKWFSDKYQYSNAKLANLLFSNELARRLKGTGVTSNCVHPGVVRTNIARNMHPWLRSIFNAFIGFLFKNPEDGAQTSLYLAVAEEVANVSGKYFVDCKEAKMSTTAQDEKFAQDLWDECVKIVKLERSEIQI